MRTDAKVCHVEIDGRVVVCALRGKLFEHASSQKNPIAVGDLVRVDLATDPAGLEEVLPRRNWLGRLASSHDPREQVLFANVDRLYAVTSVRKPGFSSNRADRILAACAWYQIPATLVLNKIDLAEPDELERLSATYERAGIPVLQTCALDGRGVRELANELAGRVTALYGGSGVGKSSLLNAIQPALGLKIGKISRYWDAGKHTTTASVLLPLEGGGAVIDTPGIRVFRLHGATMQDLRSLFPEFTKLQGRCHYPDCKHLGEPDCAVTQALAAGEIAESRYGSYLELADEIKRLPEPGEEPEGEEPEE